MGNEISQMIYFVLFAGIIFIGGGFFITNTASNYGKSTENFNNLTKINQTIAVLEPAKGAFMNATASSGSPLDYASAVANGVLAAGKLMFAMPDIVSSMVGTGIGLIGLDSATSLAIQTTLFWVFVMLVLVGLFFFVRWGQL